MVVRNSRIELKDNQSRWFAANMGTGIASTLLHQLPYNGKWPYWLSVIIFCLNVLLFFIFFCISTIKFLFYPSMWSILLRDPVQSLFIGTFPMGLATIVNMVVYVCVPYWGYRAIQLVCISASFIHLGFRITYYRHGFYGG
jgi:tellurite resistance protein TehA-like permease